MILQTTSHLSHAPHTATITNTVNMNNMIKQTDTASQHDANPANTHHVTTL